MRVWPLALLLIACGRTTIYAPAPVSTCGDNVVQTGEQCDDGNARTDDACVKCRKATCGDGFVRAGIEACDSAQGCTSGCAFSTCGDGAVQGAEECDDGNDSDGDACTSRCLHAHCGDGWVFAGHEQCDDANPDDTDACTNACEFARCGDGVPQPGNDEACDDGNSNDDDACVFACQRARCGDGLVQLGVEQCDDGNLNENDRCTTRCAPPGCGDGTVNTRQEQCDDGNNSNTDGCLTACLLPRCGDGFVRAGVEACDDGNSTDDDFCDLGCRPPVCGDGKRAGNEQCDLGALNADRPAFQISQPSGTSIATDALVRNKSAVAFYSYSSASSHTGLERVGESRIYLYVDSNTGRLSLVLTHGIDFNSSGQRQPASAVNMDIRDLPSGVTLDVVDDPGLTPPEASQSGSQATGRWIFDGNSDGCVLGGLPFPGRWKVTVTPSFIAGLTTWGWVRDDGVRIPLQMTEPITIEAFDTSTFCRPDCTVPRCGDGRLNGGEVCDDGNTTGGDGCSSDCKSLR